MSRRILRFSLIVFALSFSAGVALALGLQLSETKEQLGLKYDVSVTDHGTERVTVNVTIGDQGRLKPLDGVELVVADKAGPGYVDLSVPIATREADGKLSATVHLRKELAERAEIQLRTRSLDGRQDPLTWYYHSIHVAEYLKNGEPKKN